MSALHSIQTLAQTKALIDNEDLSLPINRLIHIERWSKQDALAASKQYRNYLYLKKKYGNSKLLPPSTDIDEFWHAHILHTKQYIEFCNKIFGAFLHHSPEEDHTGIISDKKNQIAVLFENETQKLYYQEFGEYIYAIRDKPLLARLFTMFTKSKDRL